MRWLRAHARYLWLRYVMRRHVILFGTGARLKVLGLTGCDLAWHAFFRRHGGKPVNLLEPEPVQCEFCRNRHGICRVQWGTRSGQTAAMCSRCADNLWKRVSPLLAVGHPYATWRQEAE